MRTIGHYMTRQPWAVQIDDSISLARQMLAEREIHHLPVLDAGVLVGMVTERELGRASPGEAKTVGQVMTLAQEVDANLAFGAALEGMLDRQRDAIVITSAGQVEGIFTAMDAVRVLRERLRAPPRRSETPPGRARHRGA